VNSQEEEIKEIEYILHSLPFMFTKYSRTLLDTD